MKLWRWNLNFNVNLSPRQHKLATWVGIPLSYFVCLFVFVRLTFPYDTLKERILSEFNATEKERTLSIEQLSGSGLFGVQADGVTLQDRASGGAAESAAAEPAAAALDDDSEADDAEGEAKEAKPKAKPKARRDALHFDSIDLGFSLLSYVIGNLKVSFAAEIGGGTIEGSFFQNDLVAKLAVEGEAVDISELTLLGKAVGLPLGGALSGHVELELPERSMSKAVGAFEITVAELTVGDGKAKVRNTIALPRLNAGTLNLKAKATDGKLDLETFGADGPDFEMKSEGKVRLRQPFDKSLADIEVAFRFKDAYKNKSDMTKSLFGSADSKVPGLFDMDPTVRRAKDAEGFYRWKVTGLITSPGFRPATISAARRTKDAAAGRAKADSDESADEEE